ncbi:hypothetical protein QAD02_003836 [Eretmocerus hayati]|uniref:Uncharacterized protein n=1 Tax=Eretmocerus hayati TaxID=131215 RepID=A0ACC2NNA2_9HYME|nr:hypothetical protein QAD02_003836 [Eretmocerus hayati]
MLIIALYWFLQISLSRGPQEKVTSSDSSSSHFMGQNPPNKLAVYYQNTRSLDNKISLLRSNIHQLHKVPDILLFTETWLLVAINKAIPATENDGPEDLELLIVKFELEEGKYILLVIYIPPSNYSRRHLYSKLAQTVDHLANRYRQHEFIIAGDFNLPYIRWTYNPLTVHENEASLDHRVCANLLQQIAGRVNLEQYCKEILGKGYSLELLFAHQNS